MSGGGVGRYYVLDAISEGLEPGRRPALTLVDPRVRILAVAVFAIVVVLLTDFAALGVALALSIAALIHTGLPVGSTLKRMIMMDTFVIFMILSMPFTVPGDVAFTVLGLDASWQGIDKALQIGIKANAIILMLMVVVGTMSPTTLGHALGRLKIPMPLVHLLLFTVRYIEVLYGEYKRLRTAMRTRGFRASTNRHTLRTVGYMLGMLLVRAVDRSERILQAMKCRGFNGSLPIIDDLAFAARRDGAFIVLTAGVIAALVALEVLHVATL